jgi:hypothetical protein
MVNRAAGFAFSRPLWGPAPEPVLALFESCVSGSVR